MHFLLYSEIVPEATKELLERYHLVKVPGGGYALGDTYQNWEVSMSGRGEKINSSLPEGQ